jgi:hypothetical protein
MAFNVFCVTDIGDQSDSYAYPPTNDNCKPIEEKWDCGLKNALSLTGFGVEKKQRGENDYRDVFAVVDTNIDIYVTDSRIILLCEKYDKGGGHWGVGVGGVAVALAANAVSKINAASRSKGKVLLGHLRYEWLALVEYRRKSGWFGNDAIQLYYQDDERTWWLVSLSFNKGTDTTFIANNILQRACKYRLAMNDEKGEKEVEFFKKYANGTKITPNSNPKYFSALYSRIFTLPQWAKINVQTNK